MTLAHLDDFRDEDELDAVEARRVAPHDLIEREQVAERLGASRPPPSVIISRDDLSRDRAMRRRLRLVPPKTVSERPLTRGECVDAPRPCPFISCKYHLALEVTQRGRSDTDLRGPNLGGGIKVMRPDILDADGVPDLDLLEETCMLDVADRGGCETDDGLAELLNVSRQSVETTLESALEKVRPLLAALLEG